MDAERALDDELARLKADNEKRLAEEAERVRDEAKQALASQLAAANERADREREEAARLAREEAEAAANARLATEIGQVREEAERKLAETIAVSQAEAERLREQTGDAREAAELEAAQAFQAELARVRAEAEEHLADELERARIEAERIRAAELAEVEKAAERQRRLALLAPDDAGKARATVAGVLLCSGRPDEWVRGAAITATCYRGTDRASGQLDAREIVGPLHRQIADAMAFAVRNMRVAARKDPARVDIPEYSRRALFEAVVNAVAHRDYSMGGRIRFSMFRDRLEIQSPGTLANNLGLDDLGSRVATRNEALVSVLMRMPVEGIPGSEERVCFMERRGDGIEIIRSQTRDLGGRLPLFDLPGEAEVRVVIPAAFQEPTPANVVIGVRSGNRPVAGATLLALFPNRTGKRASTDQNGEAQVDLHSTHLPMTVFAAAPGYAAGLETEWVPSDRALVASLGALPAGGSVIFPEGSGEIPGLTGRLNPVRDSLDRMYLYATNISINDGKPQPVLFVPGEELRLTDADGRDLMVRIVAIEGRAALVEYRTAPHGA